MADKSFVIYLHYKAKISSGQLKPGDFLPSTRRIAAEFKVSPDTVGAARGILVEEGLVEVVRTARANGTVVRA